MADDGHHDDDEDGDDDCDDDDLMRTLTREVSVPMARKRPSGERSKAVTRPEFPNA